MKKQLPVTYFSQRDNLIKPNFSCFPTSLAMAIDYILQQLGKSWKDVAPEGTQMEDHINTLLEDDETTAWLKSQATKLGGWILTATRRENWYAEAYIFNRILANYSFEASYRRIRYSKLRDRIDNDIPVVIGGNYSSTSRVGPHVVCAVGYDTAIPGIIVNDPFGSALNGYPQKLSIVDHEKSGRGVTYPMKYYGDGTAINSIYIEKK